MPRPAGFKHSEETKRKIGASNKQFYREHPEVRARLRAAALGNKGVENSGEEGHNFKGGVGRNGYHWTCNYKLKEEVRERDNHTCQLCNVVWIEGERLLETHHIYGPDDRPLPCTKEKLITLCPKCHKIVQPNFERYIPQFEAIIRRRHPLT